jgi:hypothetical protein
MNADDTRNRTMTVGHKMSEKTQTQVNITTDSDIQAPLLDKEQS